MSRRAAWVLVAAAMVGAAGFPAAAGPRAGGSVQPTAAAGLQRFVLGNGATVILQPVPGVGRIGVEAVYRVGFLDEPAGLAQAAHLIEHLACMAGTRSHAPGETFKLLNERGMANAETLADWTHYDMTAPAADLELILKIEAERLTSLNITPEVVAQEAPRCYAEVTFVEGAPGAPLLKFAFMAAHQAWRHRKGTALVRGGLAEAPIEDLRGFHRRTYTPGNLILTLAGDFDPADAERLVREHIGPIPAGQDPPTPDIDWAGLPRETTIRWDCARAAAILAFPPPVDPAERIALSLWGAFAAQELRSDPAVGKLTQSATCSSNTWPAGRLPFFLYGTVRGDADPAAAGAALRGFAAAKRSSKVSAATRREILAFLNHAANPPPLNPGEVRRQAQNLKGMARGKDPLDLILGNAALQMATRELLLGGDPAVVDRARTIADTGMDELIARTLDPERAITTLIVPKD